MAAEEKQKQMSLAELLRSLPAAVPRFVETMKCAEKMFASVTRVT